MNQFVASLVLFALVASVTTAEARYLPSLEQWFVIREQGVPNSDAIRLEVRLLSNSRALVASFPNLVGPIHLSEQNAQLFSCEANWTIATSEARAFGLDGKPAFSFAHLGFLRICGVTDDQALYWLHYNVAVGGVPSNWVVVLDATGTVVERREFPEARSVKFEFGGKSYSLEFPAAEMPG